MLVQFFRIPGAGWDRATAAAMRDALHEQVRSDVPPGVLAVRDNEPVGWCAVAPRGSYPRVGRGASVVEGYPVDAGARKTSSAELYHGPLSVFLDAGFTEVARPSAARAVVRLAL